jgi:Lrp/AsnC family transcriptional regulator, regulator for asnA, asnC and gidA
VVMTRRIPLPQGNGPVEDTGPGGNAPRSLIDETDREILRVLQVDGRTSNTEIARRLGVTETTVRKRLATMLENDLVQILAVPTPKLAGLTVSALMGISVQLSALQRVAQALKERPEVRYCGVSAGRYDLMIEAFFADHEHLVTFSSDVLGTMEGITDVETSVILKIEKFSYEWQIP